MLEKYWKEFIKKVGASNTVDHQKMEITPYRDWRIVVSVFFVALVASLGFNIYMSVQINSDSFFAASPAQVSVAKLNVEGLTKAINIIDEKQARFEKAKIEKVTIVDPSI